MLSSGSTGAVKASLHSFTRLLANYRGRRTSPYRSLAFLMLDHVGGINTLFHILTSGGTVVTLPERTPEAICGGIQRHRVQLLPTTPTFLRMLLISEAYKKYDLSSLELITYGTEPMPTATLESLHAALPGVRLKQTYGLTEVGILPTKSEGDDSLWLAVGGKGFETKIVDGVLWIRSPSPMIGYLNAPSPFDADGWMNTGDLVEQKGEYIRFLGRKSEIINVGGEKVFPAEVENLIQQLENIKEVTVRGRPSPITGNIIVATVELREPEDPDAVEERVRAACRQRLAPFKVPAMVRDFRRAALRRTLQEDTKSKGREATRVNAPRLRLRGHASEEMMTDQRRVAIVSGGSRGLGQAIVADLLQSGAIVATFSRSATRFTEERLAADPQAESFHWEAIDGGDFPRLGEFVRGVLRRYGPDRRPGEQHGHHERRPAHVDARRRHPSPGGHEPRSGHLPDPRLPEGDAAARHSGPS